MTEIIQNLVRAFFEKFIARFYVLITLGSLVVTALAVWVIATSWNINSDFKALLPQHAKAALAMTEVGDRVGSGSALFVVIDSPSREANIKFADKYAEEMRKLPSVALAHYHNEKSFFEKNALLYMDAEDIATIRTRLKKRIREEKKQNNPLFVSLKKKKKRSDDLIETGDIEEKYSDQEQDSHKEYLIADDGYSLTIVVRFVESSTDLLATNKLLDRVKALGDGLGPKDFHPEMTVDLGGGLVKRQKEYNSILDDIQASAVFTILGLFFVIALYFRRIRAIIVVLVPLVMGIVWTLAIAFSFYGELTTVTAFIFAILLGLGIDFSIHLLSGYDHERIDGHEPVEALVRCYKGIGLATVIGAFTTFVTFVVLSFAQFRGLSQFGTVASIGVLCSISAMVVVLPALALMLHRIKPYNPTVGEERVTVMDKIFTAERLKKMAIPSVIVSVLLSAFFFNQWSDLKFEENFRKIGDITPPWVDVEAEALAAERKAVEKKGRIAGRLRFKKARSIREAVDPKTFVMDREQKTLGSKYTSAVSGKQSSTPTIMLFDDAESTQAVFEHMNAMHKDGRLKTIRSLSAIYAFLPGTPEEQSERLAEIQKIRELLDKEGTAFMTDKQKDKVEEFREKLVEKPITVHDLPEWTKHLFKEAGPKAKAPAAGEEYAFEYLVYINESIDQMKGEEARKFLTEVATVANETGKDLRIGSQSYIYTAMLDEIKTDGLRMMLWALFFVALILTVSFRSPIRALVAMVPLLLGALWMFGLLAWFGVSLDFFNVIIIPVVIGIGVDDGVHFYYRYLDVGKGEVPKVVHQVGSAIFMTSVTSCIGFGGLAITNHSGLQSIGYVAIAGILSSLVATLLLMPAILTLSERFSFKWILPREG